MPRRKVTLLEVATHAGVSLSTASQAFNVRRPISARAQASVFKSAAALGYVHKTETSTDRIGLLLRPPEALPGFASRTESFSSMTGAILIGLLAAGYSVSAFQTLEEIQENQGKIRAFVLLHPNRNDGVLNYLIERDIPTITYDPDPGLPSFRWWVGPDYLRSARTLIRHLQEQGAKSIAVVAGSTRNMYMNAITGAYSEHCREVGQTPSIRFVDPAWGHDGGVSAARSLFASSPRPDAILTSSGVFAAGIIDGVHEAGFTCPNDILVASMMDGVVAATSKLPITAMRPDVHTSAHLITSLLEARLLSRRLPLHRITQLELVQRLSTTRYLGAA